MEEVYSDIEISLVHNNRVSEHFSSNVGLHQGCLLSRLIFSLYINGLHDALGEGVTISNIEVKVLMYADDIIILADNPISLQYMIRDFEAYCDFWNLKVNLDKSKIMVFTRGRGKLHGNKRIFYRDEVIERVKTYKYLGTLNLLLNFKEKLTAAKFALNSCWNRLIRNKDIYCIIYCMDISLSSKYQIFNSAAKSIICYDSQVWG